MPEATSARQPVTDSVLARIAERAASVDRGDVGTDVALAELGASGAFDAAAQGDAEGVSRLLETLAGECFATAFSAWGHNMCILFHVAAQREVPAELLDGSVPGVSAMAPAFKWASELGELPVTGEVRSDSVVLNGKIVWASNLFPNAIMVLPVLLADGTRTVARVRVGTEGVTVKPSAPLMALDGTASGSLTFENVRIPVTELFDVPLTEFLPRIRPAFLLAQSSFCIGLGARSLEEAASAIDRPGPNSLFRDRLDALRNTERQLHERRASLLEKVPSPTPVLELRLDAAHFVNDATHLEATVAGGRGYLAGTATTRRVREAAFLPVQSPTEGHLVWELERQARAGK